MPLSKGFEHSETTFVIGPSCLPQSPCLYVNTLNDAEETPPTLDSENVDHVDDEIEIEYSQAVVLPSTIAANSIEATSSFTKMQERKEGRKGKEDRGGRFVCKDPLFSKLNKANLVPRPEIEFPRISTVKSILALLPATKICQKLAILA